MVKKTKKTKQPEVSTVYNIYNQYIKFPCFAFFNILGKTMSYVLSQIYKITNLIFICSDNVLVLAYCFLGVFFSCFLFIMSAITWQYIILSSLWRGEFMCLALVFGSIITAFEGRWRMTICQLKRMSEKHGRWVCYFSITVIYSSVIYFSS